MHSQQAGAPDPEARKIKSAHLVPYWGQEMRRMQALGIDPAEIGQSLLTAALGILGETWGPEELAGICQGIAAQLFRDMRHADNALADVFTRRAAH